MLDATCNFDQLTCNFDMLTCKKRLLLQVNDPHCCSRWTKKGVDFAKVKTQKNTEKAA